MHWSLDVVELGISRANAFMSRYVQNKGRQASARHTARLYLQVCKAWEINVSKTVQAQVKVLETQTGSSVYFNRFTNS